MTEYKPILYPFIGKIDDSRSDLHLTVGDFIDRLKNGNVLRIITKPNEDYIVKYDGIYTYLFCTINDLTTYYLNVHNVDILNDPIYQAKEITAPRLDPTGKKMNLYQFKNGVECFVPLKMCNSDISIRMCFLSTFVRNAILSYLPRSSDKLNEYINLFCFFYNVSLIFSGKLNMTCFNLEKWTSFRPCYNEPDGLLDPMFNTIRLTSKQFIITKVNSDDRTMIKSSNMEAYHNDIRYGISYDIWWFHGNVNTQQIKQMWNKSLCNKFAVMHVFHTFNVSHIHVFNNAISLLKYYCYCLYRTYQAQHRFQNSSGIVNSDRRGFYGLLLNKRAMDYICNTFKFNPQCLFGIPMIFSNIVNVPTEIFTFMDMMKMIYQRIAIPRFLDFVNDSRPFVYSSMYKLLDKVAAKYNFVTTLYSEVFEVDDPDITLNNVQDIDVPTVEPITITEYSYTDKITKLFPPAFYNCQMNLDNVRTNYMYDKFHYDCVIDFDFADSRVVVDTDEKVFSNFRTNYGITKACRDTFEENVKPENIAQKYLNQTFNTVMSPIDRLFYSGYVYDFVPNYRFDNGVLDVTGSDLLSEKFNQVNNSTFKLYALFWKYAVMPRQTILTDRVSVGFMGAITEPNVHIFQNVSRNAWRVFGIGADARGRCYRSDINSPLGMDSVDYVISDMDLAITTGIDVDACTQHAVTLFTNIYHMTSVMGIFKIEYCLSKVIKALCDIPNCKYRLVKSVGSRPGSIEVFIVFWKKLPKDMVMTMDKARVIMSINSLIGDSWKPLHQVNCLQHTKIMGGHPDALSCALMAYYADEENIQDLISYVSTFCGFTKIGRFGRDLSNTKSGLVYGITSLDRLSLFARDPIFYQYSNLLHSTLKLNGTIKADFIKIEGISPITSFTNAQRYQLSNVHSDIMDKTNNQFGACIRDIGCRNFHGVIFARRERFEYIGYDTDPRLKNPQRNVQVQVMNVSYGDVVNMLASPCSVIVYNSLFMTYNSNKKLYDDIKTVIGSVKKDSCLVFSVYVCDEVSADAVVAHSIGSKHVTNVDGYNQINLSLGSYAPVATLTPEQYDDLVTRKYDNAPSISQIMVSKSDLYYGALAYGRFPNGEADYLLPLLNTVQRSLIVSSSNTNVGSVMHSVIIE